MIVFDLRCGANHVFEAWFGSSDDYAAQQERGLVSCPLCGDTAVSKAVMAPRLGTGSTEAPALPVATGPAETKSMLAAMAKIQAKLLEKSDWVGPRFVDQARSMHLGEIDHRPIHGQATRAQAAALADEGIEVASLPFPVAPPETRN